jgi:DNA polymerase
MASQADALSLLRLHLEWGVDETLEDLPVNRLADPRPAPLARPVPQAPAVTPAERVLALTGQANTLEALRAVTATQGLWPLRDTATATVLWAGDPAARVLLVGDPPTQEDERAGAPFAGQNGVWLDAMLAAVGLRRDVLLLAPLVPWRPPGGRPVTPAELQLCLPLTHRLIALVEPALLVVAGAQASRAVLGARVRADVKTGLVAAAIPGLADPVAALILPFPAQTQRPPAARREAWAALRRLRRLVDSL